MRYLPVSRRSGLPGSRVEAYRAGMTMATRMIDFRVGRECLIRLTARVSGKANPPGMTNALQCPTNDEGKTSSVVFPSSLVGHSSFQGLAWLIRSATAAAAARAAEEGIDPLFQLPVRGGAAVG